MTASALSTKPLRRTALLHIGDRKAGSTTIQRFMELNEAALGERGFIVSRAAFRRVYHSGLTCYALDDRVLDTAPRNHWDVNSAEALAAFRKTLERDLRAEVDAAPGDATILFSHEDLFRLERTEVERLATFLRSIFDEFKVVVYLRRQVDRDASEYGQMLKGGHTDPDILGHCRSDYNALLDRWSKSFGEAAISPRIFAPADFVDGDLIKDFCAVAELGDPSGYEEVEAANESLSIIAQDYLRAFNTVWSKQQGFPFGLVAHTVIRDFSGSGRRPSRDAGRAHMERYKSSNEKVRKKWFPERRTLFDEDLSTLPEQEAPTSSLEETMVISLRLFHKLGEQIEGLRTNINRAMERNEQVRRRKDALRARFEAQTTRSVALNDGFREAKRLAAEAVASKDPEIHAAALAKIATLKIKTPAVKPPRTTALDDEVAVIDPALKEQDLDPTS